jgi:cytochrome c553
MAPFCALVFLYPPHAQGQDSAQFFERTIRPLLSEKCSSCHGELETSGLRVDSRDRLLRGGSQGPAIVAGDPESSLLMQAVRHSHATLKMPPSGQLSPQEIRSLAAWIQQGAVWPDAPEKATQLDGTVITQEDRAFWSFQPIKKPLVDTASPIDQASPIDRLVKRSLQKNGLKPNPPAAKRTLLRRVNFDLIGLPPTPEEVSAFLSDDSPQAFAKVVDGLLASPHFGERWGRYWLDVARYGENDYHGVGIAEYPQAWRYRDWVVGAFNSDMPYDVFVKAQIAADLMPGDNRELLGGLGLFGLGPWYYGISHPPQARADERHERVDMVSRGFLGLTAACARCHDHKYDPISMQDYYGLAGVFASVHYKKLPPRLRRNRSGF